MNRVSLDVATVSSTYTYHLELELEQVIRGKSEDNQDRSESLISCTLLVFLPQRPSSQNPLVHVCWHSAVCGFLTGRPFCVGGLMHCLFLCKCLRIRVLQGCRDCQWWRVFGSIHKTAGQCSYSKLQSHPLHSPYAKKGTEDFVEKYFLF